MIFVVLFMIFFLIEITLLIASRVVFYQRIRIFLNVRKWAKLNLPDTWECKTSFLTIKKVDMKMSPNRVEWKISDIFWKNPRYSCYHLCYVHVHRKGVSSSSYGSWTNDHILLKNSKVFKTDILDMIKRYDPQSILDKENERIRMIRDSKIRSVLK